MRDGFGTADVCESARRGAQPSQPPGRPGPGEVVTPDRSERVQHLAAQKQTLVSTAFERLGIHLAQVDSTSGDFCLRKAAIASPRKFIDGEHVDQGERSARRSSERTPIEAEREPPASGVSARR